MVGMTVAARREWTRDDLASLPDDGRRYEIIDGDLIVSASPNLRHQRIVRELAFLLASACPPHLEVLFAPFDVLLDDRSVVVPDVLVARRDRLEERALRGAPELAVEVLSPGTARVDRTVKLRRYEREGMPSYWLVDPDGDEGPELTVFELRDDRFSQVAVVTGEQSWEAQRPFSVTLTPSAWLR